MAVYKRLVSPLTVAYSAGLQEEEATAVCVWKRSPLQTEPCDCQEEHGCPFCWGEKSSARGVLQSLGLQGHWNHTENYLLLPEVRRRTHCLTSPLPVLCLLVRLQFSLAVHFLLFTPTCSFLLHSLDLNKVLFNLWGLQDGSSGNIKGNSLWWLFSKDRWSVLNGQAETKKS